MTQRETFFFTQLAERYNEVFLEASLMRTENDTLTKDVNELKTELERAYREISELRGEIRPLTPTEEFFRNQIQDQKLLTS